MRKCPEKGQKEVALQVIVKNKYEVVIAPGKDNFFFFFYKEGAK